jgi:hypothetical protein
MRSLKTTYPKLLLPPSCAPARYQSEKGFLFAYVAVRVLMLKSIALKIFFKAVLEGDLLGILR